MCDEERINSYTSTLLNSHAPRETKSTMTPATTMASMPILYCETPVKAARRPSTPYVNGLKKAIQRMKAGAVVKGKSAPDRKNNGMLTRFMMRPKPCMSSMVEAMAVPKAVKTSAIENMNKRPQRTAAKSGLKPMTMVMMKQ